MSTQAWTTMFRAILSIVAKTRKQLKCPSLGDWINKLWYVRDFILFTSVSPVPRILACLTHNRVLNKIML